jgi:hypothetical protein
MLFFLHKDLVSELLVDIIMHCQKLASYAMLLVQVAQAQQVAYEILAKTLIPMYQLHREFVNAMQDTLIKTSLPM